MVVTHLESGSEGKPYDVSDEPYRPTPRKKSGCGGGCLGCSIALLLVFALITAGVYFVIANGKSIAANAASMTLTSLVADMKLPQDQEQRIVARIESLKQDYLDGNISNERLLLIVTHLQRGPVIGIGMVTFAERQYIDPSGLGEEAKVAGRHTLRRLARGIEEDLLGMQVLERVLAPISEQDAEGNWTLKDRVTDAELEEALKRAKLEVDTAKVSDEPYEPNVADAFDQAIEDALNDPG